MSNYSEMNKGQLRQAMRDAGLSYAGLNNSGMVAALVAHNIPSNPSNELAQEVQENPEADLAAGAAFADYIPSANAAPTVHNYLPTPEQQAEDAAVLAQEEARAESSTPTAETPAPSTPRATSKGVKIEKERPTQNGVKMPSTGTLCRAVWDELQRAVDAGTPHTVKSIKEFAPSQGWNTNNAAIEFYNWRKFKGISGRSK